MLDYLSVSSNGSLWVKRVFSPTSGRPHIPFSILERIVVGETFVVIRNAAAWFALSVSSNGSLWVKHIVALMRIIMSLTFSILERIVVGETEA